MRCAVISTREVRRVPWNGGVVQAEDVLVDCLGAELHLITPKVPSAGRSALDTRLGHRIVSLGGLTTRRLDPEPGAPADLAFIAVNDLFELALVMSTRGWDRVGETNLLHVSEISERDLRRYPETVRRLVREVDHLFVGTEGVDLGHLRAKRLRTVEVVPPLLDVLAVPVEGVPSRPIDIVNVGRRSPDQHVALTRWVEANGGFYWFDTHRIKDVGSVLEHRAMYNAVAARTKVFITNTARFDDPVHRTGTGEVGARFYEAMAAGCVLAGDMPVATRAFRERIAPVDPIPFPLRGSDLPGDLIDVVRDEPTQRSRSVTTRRFALLHHDIAHRWVEMVTHSGLPISPGVTARLATLAAQAGSIAAVQAE